MTRPELQGFNRSPHGIQPIAEDAMTVLRGRFSATVLPVLRFLSAGAIGFVAAHSWTAAMPRNPSDQDETPIATLRRLGTNAKTGLSDSELVDVSRALARYSLMVRAASIEEGSAPLADLSSLLASKQRAWQDAQTRGVNEQRLRDLLNSTLELNQLPEELRIRSIDLRRNRTRVWLELPELSTGITRTDARAGTPLFGPTMAPFEAFLVGEWTLYSKLFDPEHTRTESEEQAALRGPRRVAPEGLFVLEPNPRGERLQRHLESVARRKWLTPSAVVAVIADIMEKADVR